MLIVKPVSQHPPPQTLFYIKKLYIWIHSKHKNQINMLFMKKLKIFAICLIACSLIYSCSESKEEELVQEVENHEFFKVKPDNKDVQLLYNYLKNSEANKEKIANNIWGTPYWNSEISYPSMGKNMNVLPMVDEVNKEITSVLVIGVDEETIDYGMYINDEDRYPTEDFGWIFAYFKQQVFNINDELKFIDVPQKELGDKTKGWVVTCTDVYAGNDNIGWFRRNTICVDTYIPSVPRAITDRDGSEEEYSGSTSNPGGGNPNPNPNPLPKVIPTPAFNKTKAACIYDKIKNETSVLKDLLKDFMPTTSTFNLHFDVGYIPMDMSTGSPRTVYGKTYGTRSSKNPENDGINHKSIYIKINKDFVNNSNLLICNTILHEIIHAEIYKTQEEATKDNGKVNPKILKESYPGLIETYMEINNFSEAQHIYMINQMHNKMVSILKWFDKNNHSQEEYEALAWLGLSKNKVFKSKFNTQQIERIKKIQKKLIDEKDTCD
jgi:hypothetical protein